MKNRKIVELAIEAGFVPWGDEPWNSGDVFDWSSNYDVALEKFGQLLLREAFEQFRELERTHTIGASIIEVKRRFANE